MKWNIIATPHMCDNFHVQIRLKSFHFKKFLIFHDINIFISQLGFKILFNQRFISKWSSSSINNNQVVMSQLEGEDIHGSNPTTYIFQPTYKCAIDWEPQVDRLSLVV